MTNADVEGRVPLSVTETRDRIMSCADKYHYNPMRRSRAAGSRPFIVEQRGPRLAVSRRTWLPDPWGLEAAVDLQGAGANQTTIRATFRIPIARLVVTGALLTIFVGLPLLALAAPSGVDRSGTVVMIALALTLLVVLPLAARLLRRDPDHLRAFFHDCFPERRSDT